MVEQFVTWRITSLSKADNFEFKLSSNKRGWLINGNAAGELVKGGSTVFHNNELL
jgi:hypothetical protein